MNLLNRIPLLPFIPYSRQRSANMISLVTGSWGLLTVDDVARFPNQSEYCKNGRGELLQVELSMHLRVSKVFPNIRKQYGHFLGLPA